MMELTQALHLAVSVGLGVLVGFQREWVEKRLAGIRTFPLVTLFGTLSAWLAEALGGWVFGAALLALAAIVWVGSGETRTGERPESGITTEVAVLVMFAVGGVVALGQLVVAIAVTGSVAVLLHWKQPLHAFVRGMDADELRSIMRLVLIALVVLPALPDRSYGPFQVLNPFQIWSMVVLIVGISLGAYLAQRVAGSHVGTFVAGVLGGLISSTATTVSYARQTRDDLGRVPATALVLALSSTVVLPRVSLLAFLVAPELALTLALPLMCLFAVMVALCAGVWLRTRQVLGTEAVEHEPSDLRAAIGFGLLYAAVLLGVAATRHYFGEGGLYAVAAFSGLTDVDAITLSTVRLTQVGRIGVDLGWQLILVGVASNLVFKAGVALLLGHPRLRPWVAAVFGVALAASLALLGLWPDSAP